MNRLSMTWLVAALLALLPLTAPAAEGEVGEAAGKAAVEVKEAAAEHGGAAHTEEPALLKEDHGTAIWTLILFLGLIVLLGKFVWPGIVQGLNDREQKIRGDIESAENANRQARQTLADYERKLAEAHAEARKLVEQARGDAERVRQQLATQTEAEIAKMRERAKQEIKDARNQAVQELYARASELSIAVAEKILQRQITDADTQAMVDRSLKELDQLKAG